MKETELKLNPCYCGGKMEIKKVTQNGGMDGSYLNWELTCKKCGMTMTYAADGFYGRKYKTFEEVVDDWNRNWENKNGIPIPEGHEKLCDAEKVIEGLKGIERLHADDELRSSILEVINASII